jgi:Fe-S cluster assembly protein SufB
MSTRENNISDPKKMVANSLPSGGTLLSSSNPVEEDTALLKDRFKEKYKWGFVTDIEADSAPPGLDESTIAFISAKKKEPQWLLDWRLKAYKHWLTMEEPEWAFINYTKPNYDEIIFYSAPKSLADGPKSLDEVDPALLETYKKLGIPLAEHAALAGVAVDAVFDSVSVGTTFKDKLEEVGIIFCPISEAVQEHPELVQKYLGSVVPYSDNYYATLNSAVFTDGSFVYIPKDVKCPMDLSTYFRINAKSSGQFERTLIIAEEGASVSYLEGCTAPMRDENQLHAAVVELVALDDANIKYSTVQNWYPGDENGVGGIYNFVTKRGKCQGDRSRICWTQVETGSAITWKYPSCILLGDDSVGEFYSVALTNNYQQADTGTKTRSTIISKGISAGHGQNAYRGLVKIMKGAENSRNYTQCDSMLMGDRCGAHTFPYIEIKNTTSKAEHEASTSKIGEDQLFYCNQRGISTEDAINMIVNGFCKEVFRELPMEFAVEARRLLEVSLEASVG